MGLWSGLDLNFSPISNPQIRFGDFYITQLPHKLLGLSKSIQSLKIGSFRVKYFRKRYFIFQKQIDPSNNLILTVLIYVSVLNSEINPIHYFVPRIFIWPSIRVIWFHIFIINTIICYKFTNTFLRSIYIYNLKDAPRELSSKMHLISPTEFYKTLSTKRSLLMYY